MKPDEVVPIRSVERLGLVSMHSVNGCCLPHGILSSGSHSAPSVSSPTTVPPASFVLFAFYYVALAGPEL